MGRKVDVDDLVSVSEIVDRLRLYDRNLPHGWLRNQPTSPRPVAKLAIGNAWSATSFVEFGATGELGLGVAGFSGWSVARADLPSISGCVTGPVEVPGPTPFRLLAVWSCLSDHPKVNPVIEALDAWAEWLDQGPVVVAGDFNTGGWWSDIRNGPCRTSRSSTG